MSASSPPAGLLEPAEGECYLAFDYLVDAAARDPTSPPIPDETCIALIDHAEPADPVAVAWQASFMEKAQYVIRFFDRARSRAICQPGRDCSVPW